MPGFDGSGPRGQGPMTCGGFGYCAGGSAQRFGFGRGCGMGRGQGRGGYGRQFAGGQPGGRFAQLSEADEKSFLESRMQWLEQEAARIRERLAGQQG
jgi:hypothetical protein